MMGGILKMARHFKEIPLWRNVTEEEWNDWKWQLRNRIMDVDTLKQVINLTPEEERCKERFENPENGDNTVLRKFNGPR